MQHQPIVRNPRQVVQDFPFMPHEDQAHQSNVMDAGIFTLNIPIGAQSILVQALTQNIRYTLDGTNPSPTSGFRLTAGNDPLLIQIQGGRITLKFSREVDGAILEYQYGL